MELGDVQLVQPLAQLLDGSYWAQAASELPVYFRVVRLQVEHVEPDVEVVVIAAHHEGVRLASPVVLVGDAQLVTDCHHVLRPVHRPELLPLQQLVALKSVF